MKVSTSESQQTQTFSVDHENVLPEHYRLIELIGRGGMAEVYLAEDRRLGRKVAIKFLSQEFRRDPDRVRRFRQEARSASALNHPNILIIHDIGDRSGVQFIVSEFVQGETLGTRIAQGRVPFAEAVDIAIQVASALAAAHNAGIVHRDIKPDNIMIRNDGVVKVLDFGLAKARGFTTSNGSLLDAMTIDSGSTSPGLIVGTPQYMSPEQARGKELDGRTDIFSLGIIIFEMLTRHSPFAGGSFADTMAAILTKEPRRMEEFVENAPARLIGLVDKCLRKERDERFASMVELETELKLLRTEVISTPKDTAEVDPAKSDRTEIRPTHQHSIRRFVSNTFEHRPPWAVPIILLAAALLVGGWWAWDRVSLLSPAPSLMRTVPITSWSSSASELVSAASFSPNGSMVAYSVRKGDATEIWVKPVVGGDPVQVTKSGGHNQYPIWSADGQQIAFFSNRGDKWGIWRIPFTGGIFKPVVGDVAANARPVNWDKNGYVYYQAARDMFRVSAESGASEQITNLSESGSTVVTLEVSHDGKFVAYSMEEDKRWKLKVLDLSRGDVREIANTEERIDFISWHPSGRSLFASFSVEGALQVVEVAADGSSVSQRTNGDIDFVVHDVSENGSVLYGSLSETSDLWRIDSRDGKESIVANDISSEFWPDVAPDGSIAFQSVKRVAKPERGSVRIRDTSSNIYTASESGFSPSWSNKGDWVAFFRRDNAGLTVWKARANGVDPARISDAIVSNPTYFFVPYIKTGVGHLAWSPDDSEIAIAVAEKGTSKLWISTTDGTRSGRLLNPEVNPDDAEHSPVWSPDGRKVYYAARIRAGSASRTFIYRIRVTDISSGDNHLLFESEEPIRILGISENGQKLIFAKRNEPSDMIPAPPITDVWAIGVPDGKARKVRTLENAYFHNIHLSDDGTTLAFITRSGDITRLVLASLESSDRELLVINDPKVLISTPAFSPDGSFIVFGKQTRTNQLSMLTH